MASPIVRTIAIATKPMTNTGTSVFQLGALRLPVHAVVRRPQCIHVSSGITAARHRLRVSFVTVATRSTTSSANICRYVSAAPTTCDVS